jgi:hypothetical protein
MRGMAKIEDDFKDLSVVPGSTLILRVPDAIAFVLQCREKKIKVLGIDGFRLTATAIQPDLGESIDLSTAVRHHYRRPVSSGLFATRSQIAKRC